jgi:hypothetical protein
MQFLPPSEFQQRRLTDSSGVGMDGRQSELWPRFALMTCWPAISALKAL